MSIISDSTKKTKKEKNYFFNADTVVLNNDTSVQKKKENKKLEGTVWSQLHEQKTQVVTISPFTVPFSVRLVNSVLELEHFKH